MSTYDINKIQLPNGDICNLRDEHVQITKSIQETNLIHIEDAVEKPLKECRIGFSPIQDLHGYSNPWPAGGGKNLFLINMEAVTVSGVTFTPQNDGTIIIQGTPTANITSGVVFGTIELPAGDYQVNGFETGGSGSNRMAVQDYTNKSTLVVQYAGETKTFTLNATTQVRIYTIILQRVGAIDTVVKPMICKASETNMTYAPYANTCPITGWTGTTMTVSPTTDEADGMTYSVTFPSEAGTVYGGTIDIAQGKLIVNKGIYIADGSTDVYQVSRHSSGIYYTIVTNTIHGNVTNLPILSDRFISNRNVAVGHCYLTREGTIIIAILPDQSLTTVAQVTQWFAEHPTTFVYDLEEPIEYQFTPIQVQLFSKINNLWTNTNAISCTYYIESEINSELSNIALPIAEFIVGTNTASSNTLTGVCKTALFNGKMITYYLPYATAENNISLTLYDTAGTSLGNYLIYINNTTQNNRIYEAGTMLFLVYYNNKYYIVNPYTN